ncbi:MAG: hypothetical protein ACLU1U_05160 [Lachnospiraceae bacterium]
MFCRGVRLVQVPTTLLSMLDSRLAAKPPWIFAE